MMHNIVPLSQPQQRIWLTQNIYPQSPMYNIGGTVAISGTIDAGLMQQAIRMSIRKHDAFQIRITYKDQNPMQYFCNAQPIIEYIDFSVHGKRAEKQYKKWESRLSREPFQMIESPLYQFAVIKLKNNLFGYFIKLHHIIADGWSIQILTDEICQNYLQIKNGDTGSCSENSQYQDYILDEQKYLNSLQYEKDKAYWLKELCDAKGIYNKSERYIDGTRFSFSIPHKKSLAIRNFCDTNNISLNCFMLSLYLMYYYCNKGDPNIVIGIPVLGRIGPKQRSTIGMFVSTIPLSIHIDSEMTFTDLLYYVNSKLRKGYAHQKYPYNHLIREKNLNDQILFEDSINYYGTSICREFDGYTSENTEFYNGQQAYSLQIIVREWNGQDEIQLDIDAANSLYSYSQIDEMFHSLMEFVDTIFETAEEPLTSFGKRMHGGFVAPTYNQTTVPLEAEVTIIHLFERIVAKYPNRIAIECGGQSCTYAQFQEKLRQTCTYLKTEHVTRGSVIAIMATHSIETVATIWGILAYGCTFLPIDPKTPSTRTCYMLSDANAKLLLTNVTFARFSEWICKVVNLEQIFRGDSDEYENCSDCGELAYILYTSGSTGRPKGVEVTHKNLFNYISWASHVYTSEPNISDVEVFALYTSIAFDLTITTLFTPLVTGGLMIIYPEQEDEHALFRILRENRCTTIKLTPSHLSMMQEKVSFNSSLRQLIVGGEALKTSLARHIYYNSGGNLRIINEYGPTEATVGCMFHCFDSRTDIYSTVPIGKPAWNTEIYILNDNMHEVSIGEIGEIYIAGENVALGYLNQSDMTDRSFIFVDISGTTKRLYRTGDTACFTNEQTMIYCGRIDSQVKIRGHRIEVQEIETVIAKYPGVLSVFVTALENNAGSLQLCGYFTAEIKVPEEKLLEYLQDYLQPYMIPSWLMQIDSFPMTNNGKLDTSQLPILTVQVSSDMLPITNPLIEISSRVLGVSGISPKDNYYQLGGDSITAIQISSGLREKGYLLTVKSILENPVFQVMENCMIKQDVPIAEQGYCKGAIETTPIYDWFFSQPIQNRNTYFLELQLVLKRSISVAVLEQALMILVQHHDMLRINVNRENKIYYNDAHLRSLVPVNDVDCIGMLPEEFEDTLKTCRADILNQFDVYSSLLIGSALLYGHKQDTWYIQMHHLTVDGVSLRVIIEDLSAILNNLLRGQEQHLPKKTMSFQTYADMLVQHRLKTTEENAHQIKKIYLPVDTQTVVYTFDCDITHKLLHQANQRYSTRPAELLLAALVYTMRKNLCKEQWTLLIEGHGRDLDEADVSRTIGWFTNLAYFPIERVDITMGDIIVWSKEVSRKAVPETSLGNKQNVVYENQMRFNYMGEFLLDYELFQVEPVFPIQNELLQSFEFDALIAHKKLVVCIRMENTALGCYEDADALMEEFRKRLQEILAFCCETADTTLTPSDFTSVQLTQGELESLFY